MPAAEAALAEAMEAERTQPLSSTVVPRDIRGGSKPDWGGSKQFFWGGKDWEGSTEAHPSPSGAHRDSSGGGSSAGVAGNSSNSPLGAGPGAAQRRGRLVTPFLYGTLVDGYMRSKDVQVGGDAVLQECMVA